MKTTRKRPMSKRPIRWLPIITAGSVILGVGLPGLATVSGQSAQSVTFQVDTSKNRGAISPYIYGTNQDLTGSENFTVRRLGGNRMTGFNWENNYSNAGSDWQHSSDNYACTYTAIPTDLCSQPGAVPAYFHNKSLEQKAYSLITLPLAGYVSRDGNGTVLESEKAPSGRWDQVVYAKNAPFKLTPDLTDGKVYPDEFVNYLVQKFGSASTPNGVKGYSLDNEPGLWPNTHPRIHPDKLGAKELIDRSVALSKAVKKVDPEAEVFGPAAFGISEMVSLVDAPDWSAVKGNYDWYVDYYLDQMRSASQSEGKRLLDVLDVHWYPEAKGGGIRITEEVGTSETKKARMQATRSLWDPTYTEDSWIGQWLRQYLPLLPRLQQSIDKYNPGTKLAITEFNYGGENDISGGIAMADALGIFGKYGVYMANNWKLKDQTDYMSAAYKLYRNYDGKNSSFGNIRVSADTSDIENSSVYSSVVDDTNKELHLIIMNKNMDSPMEANVNLAGGAVYRNGRVFGFDQSGSGIKEAASIPNISNNKFTYTIPPLTAYHIVLSADSGTSNLPGKPENVTVQATLNWSASADATGYNVKRASSAAGPFMTIASGVSGTSYTDTAVTAGNTYYYIVTAVNSAGESAGSTIISVSIGTGNGVPPTPTPATPTPTPATPTPTPATPTPTPATPTPTPATPTPTPTVPAGNLAVQYRAGETNATDNQIRPMLNIKNNGSSAVNLSDLKVRYYFSKDGGPDMSSWIDWAQIGGNNINRTFTDTYVELSFANAAGAIQAGGQTGDIMLRMSKNDWSNFNEANDYSFDPTKTSYTDWNHITLYQNGTLVWGIEP